MELKPGYKQTEVGVIPEDWESTKVRRIASSARNAIVGGPFGSDLVSTDYVDDGIPVIRGQNMNGKWVSGAFVFVTPVKAKSLEANLARPGDIVFTQRGTLGQVSLVPDKPYQFYLVSQSQMKLSVNLSIAEPLFLYYVFTGEAQQELIRGGTIQTGVPHINLGILRDIPLQLPPLPEQRAIAEALSDVDALLAALDRLIAKQRDLKQATMQQLLTGQTRLPGEWVVKPGYKQTEVGVIPEDWEVKPLSNVLRKGRLGGNYTNQDAETELPLMKMGNISRGYFDLTKVEFIAQGVTPDPLHRLMHGDVLFNTRNTLDLVGKVAIWRDELPVAYYNSNLMRLEFDTEQVCSNEYANYALNTASCVMRLRSLATGTTSVAAIYTRDLMGMHFVVPPRPEQTAIAAVLTDMDAELAALEQRRDKTRLLKQAMMQELLTGRTRLVG